MKPIFDVDTFDCEVVRRTVYKFHKSEKRMSTVSKLRQKLTDVIGFWEGNTSQRKILKKLGFKWRNTKKQ